MGEGFLIPLINDEKNRIEKYNKCTISHLLNKYDREAGDKNDEYL